ncbi:hypothetical protein [Burkholderia territorii]|uniref:hypothetical protein n=1 Tax=Burkholderia territorii TaxID=1503055 RepID=UPI000AA3BC69|nr:hypothetical protein [Burkholderia territorii]
MLPDAQRGTAAFAASKRRDARHDATARTTARAAPCAPPASRPDDIDQRVVAALARKHRFERLSIADEAMRSCASFGTEQHVHRVDPDFLDHVAAFHHEQRRQAQGETFARTWAAIRTK